MKIVELQNWTADAPEELLHRLRDIQIPSSRKRAIGDAMRELHSNALRHGLPPVEIRLNVSITEIRLTVVDAGGTLENDHIMHATRDDALMVDLNGPSAGVGLARSIRSADAVTHAVVPKQQTTITLVWNRV